MTPSAWNGLIALCTVLGLLGSVVVMGAKLVARDERKTVAIETLSTSVTKLEGHFHYVLSTLGVHTEQIGSLHERMEWVESSLDKDGRVSQIVTRLPVRRRNGGNEA